jgi:hypothetical protein
MEASSAEQAVEQALWRELWEYHRRLDKVLEDVQALARDSSYVSAAKRFGELRMGEEKHLKAEEELLGLLEHSPNCPPFVGRIRQEHQQTLKLLDDVSEILSRWDIEHFTPKLDALANFLHRHEADEKELMFPEIRARFSNPDTYRRLLGNIGRP